MKITEDLIKKELEVITSMGFYKTEKEFIKEAINNFWRQEKT